MDALKSRLCDCLAGTDQNLYIIFDSAAHPDLPQTLFQVGNNHSYEILLPNWSAEMLSALPFIVAIPAAQLENDAFLEWALQEGPSKDAVLLFASPQGLNEVVEHWRHLLKVRLPTGDVAHFRLFDVRVAKRLLPYQEASENAPFMGPMSALWLLEPDGTWQEIVHAGPGLFEGSTMEGTTTQIPWLTLSAQQYELLNQHSAETLFGNVRRHLWQHHPRVLVRYPLSWIDRMIRRGIELAQTTGFVSEYAVGQCVLLLFMYGPTWLEHERVMRLAKQIEDGDQRMDAILHKLPDDTWREIEANAQLEHDWNRLFQATIQGQDL